MNIIISIVLLSLLVLFIGSWIMFFLNFINSKYNNSTTSNADSVKLGVQQCYNTVLIALYKMYVDQDIIDYTSYAESLNANMNFLSSNPNELKSWSEKYVEYIKETK